MSLTFMLSAQRRGGAETGRGKEKPGEDRRGETRVDETRAGVQRIGEEDRSTAGTDTTSSNRMHLLEDETSPGAARVSDFFHFPAHCKEEEAPHRHESSTQEAGSGNRPVVSPHHRWFQTVLIGRGNGEHAEHVEEAPDRLPGSEQETRQVDVRIPEMR